MLELVILKEATRNVRIINTLNRALTNADIPLNKTLKRGCRVREPLVTESPAMDMEQMDLQESLGLKSNHNSMSTIQFWKEIPEKNILN
ncbi:Hypothetical predicted protein [Octopus vulgaris]|uniref:Uncharacterized protein n=1 Tax=Octopus vulgaris TaxID=6645 RepID=A0AA36BCV1_OCTVU|nr:Hypothetical predicted protein [Octopus vulgaris]